MYYNINKTPKVGDRVKIDVFNFLMLYPDVLSNREDCDRYKAIQNKIFTIMLIGPTGICYLNCGKDVRYKDYWADQLILVFDQNIVCKKFK